MDILDKAIIYAVKSHSGSFRKGTSTPYITHPIEAVSIVATMTNDQRVLAATALHDVVEDTEVTIDDIRKDFGDTVVRLVAAESENKRDSLPPKTTWKIRKQETLDHLKNATKEEKMIALGDKLSNMRAIYRDYYTVGDKLWERFNQKDKTEHAWYYKAIAELLSDLGDTFAYNEYVELVNKIFN